MRTIGNILWFVVHGVWAFIAYVGLGIAFCCTIIGIPLGLAAFNFAFFAVWPFGRTVVDGPLRGPISAIVNLFWFFFGGFGIVAIHLFCGFLLCLTIVGIPFGIQAFKLAGLALTPFGRKIVSANGAPSPFHQPQYARD